MLFKIKIIALSSSFTPILSDTLFGAFCWSYKYKYGEDRLTEMLNSFRRSFIPPLVFSNVFPSGTLPFPLGINGNNDEQLFINTDTFKRLISGQDKGTEIKAQENNNSGEFDFYLLSDLEETVLSETVSLMLQLGLGGGKSVGKGAFKLLSFEEYSFEKPKNANAFIALSNFIPAKSDPIKGFYKTFVKYGKVDREFASSASPYKKPLLFIKSGAMFYDGSPKEWYGSIIDKVSPISDDIIVNACTIAVPCTQ